MDDRVAKYTLEGQNAVLHDFEAQLKRAGIGAWFHRPRDAAHSHCALIRIDDVPDDTCRFVTSATGRDDCIALERAVDTWRKPGPTRHGRLFRRLSARAAIGVR